MLKRRTPSFRFKKKSRVCLITWPGTIGNIRAFSRKVKH